MNLEQIKIVKKHLMCRNFDEDVFILYYRFPVLHFWKEFPIYFTKEDILKDFAENAYIFKFRFFDLCGTSYLSYRYFLCNGFKITLSSMTDVIGHLVFDNGSYFTIKETLDEDSSPRYLGNKLSEAYEKYLNAPRMGLSDKIEEKIYKYKLIDGNE